MNDQQILNRPKCQKCQNEYAIGYFKTLMVCGACMIKLTEAWNEKQKNDFDIFLKERGI